MHLINYTAGVFSDPYSLYLHFGTFITYFGTFTTGDYNVGHNRTACCIIVSPLAAAVTLFRILTEHDFLVVYLYRFNLTPSCNCVLYTSRKPMSPMSTILVLIGRVLFTEKFGLYCGKTFERSYTNGVVVNGLTFVK